MPQPGEPCLGCGAIIREVPTDDSTLADAFDTVKPTLTCGNCLAPRSASDQPPK